MPIPYHRGGALTKPLHQNTCLEAWYLHRTAYATHPLLLLEEPLLPALRLLLLFLLSLASLLPRVHFYLKPLNSSSKGNPVSMISHSGSR